MNNIIEEQQRLYDKHKITIKGLNHIQMKRYTELLIMASKEQLERMLKAHQTELEKR